MSGYAVIRVRFSDQIELELLFLPLDPISTLYEVLQQYAAANLQFFRVFASN